MSSAEADASFISQDHLTQPDAELGERIRATPDGMAFWAGSGPAGKTCRECSHWSGGSRSAETGDLNDARCDQYARMTRAALLIENAPRYDIPHATAACKYFDAAPDAPPVIPLKSVPGGWVFCLPGISEPKPFKTPLAAARAGAKALT